MPVIEVQTTMSSCLGTLLTLPVEASMCNDKEWRYAIVLKHAACQCLGTSNFACAAQHSLLEHVHTQMHVMLKLPLIFMHTWP